MKRKLDLYPATVACILTSILGSAIFAIILILIMILEAPKLEPHHYIGIGSMIAVAIIFCISFTLTVYKYEKKKKN